MRIIVMIAHDIRSCHNVGSLLRTAEGLGLEKVYLTGYTPYPQQNHDIRLPHIARKLDAQIHKTALGAEKSVEWEQHADIYPVFSKLKADGYVVVALEQTSDSTPLSEFKVPEKVAVLLGREVEGIDQKLLELCDEVVEIPMSGKKESFNVVQAAAMALYHCAFSKS